MSIKKDYLFHLKLNFARIISEYNKKQCEKFLLDSKDEELHELGVYIKKNGFCVFPYDYTKKYHNMDIISGMEKGYPYVNVNNKRMYGKKSWSESEFVQYYRGLLTEWDAESPHSYDCGGGT